MINKKLFSIVFMSIIGTSLSASADNTQEIIDANTNKSISPINVYHTIRNAKTGKTSIEPSFAAEKMTEKELQAYNARSQQSDMQRYFKYAASFISGK